ncbi:unnamed protein product [Linum trigynum]|uniref:Reverse transcriptase domain-containing protein n=1 Tax=Linum trigynum TaxID=586398 RepID=A0AAV2D5B1_9ROSI
MAVSDAVGFSGGIWVLWDNSHMHLEVIDKDKQFIHLKWFGARKEIGFLTAIYASPNDFERGSLWNCLRRIEKSVDGPWLLSGDFNAMSSPEDKHGGAPFNFARARPFTDCIDDCGLVDLGFSGPKFTWFTKSSRLKERLDRSFCSLEWRQKFPGTMVFHLPKLKSDHRPILTCTTSIPPSHKPVRRFQFLAPWLAHDDFPSFFSSSWNLGFDFPSSLQVLSEKLAWWNKEIFGNIFRRKKYLMKKLQSLEILNERSASPRSLEKEKQTREELEETLWQEEVLWLQKSRANWIVHGDKNTRFFHQSTLSRRKRNAISCLKDDSGNWISDPDSILLMARLFFVELYTKEDKEHHPNLPADFPELAPSLTDRLGAPPSFEEVRATLMDMKGLKAPGKDGFHAIFFQKCWGVVGREFFLLISSCFSNPSKIRSLNQTLLALIPKVDAPASMSQFRPISLCNVGYKVVAKTIANRLKSLMPHLVHPNQSSFVPNRHITDNILILQETVHSMARKGGKKGTMLLKVDLAKAYDRIDWTFLEETLMLAGIPTQCVNIIMQCVTSVEMQVLWNGGETDPFSPTRGIRQGCPLTPYLFTLCIERLSHIIDRKVRDKKWKPVLLSVGGPPLSHLFFADDLVLFAEASVEQADCILSCLNAFCVASGELVSKDKSRVFFSKNTKMHARTNICSRLGIQPTNDLGKYLGVPVIHGRLTKLTYRYILDKIDSKLTAWKARTLSLAGRVTLAKAVLEAIPLYAMQTTLLPASVCDTIDRKIRWFVWGSQVGKRKVHLISWETICKPKNQGGLGLRTAKSLNLAYMVKLAWHVLNNEKDLWVRVLQGKYFHHKDGKIMAMKTSNHSNLWRAILKAMPTMRRGMAWSIRDGMSNGFWTHPWLDQDTVLEDYALVPLSEEDKLSCVADWTNTNGEWNWDRLKNFLPNEVLIRIAGLETPDPELGEDRTIWGVEKDGRFRLRSAYELVEGSTEGRTEEHWRDLWRWDGPNRVKLFLWLVSHNRLLTNAERKKRQMAQDGSCTHCTDEEETMEHILRRCKKTEGFWRHFNCKIKDRNNGTSFIQWIHRNTKDVDTGIDFGILCWLVWKQRNEEALDGKNYSEEGLICKAKAWLNIHRHARENTIRSLVMTSSVQVEKELSWKPPREGWYQVQADGSVLGASGMAAAGGVIRDCLGRCFDAFACNLGACSITCAELKGAVVGLERAWKLGFRKIELNLDSTTAISIIKNWKDSNHSHGLLVGKIGSLLSREWEVVISHVYREKNVVADFLASKGHSLPFGTHCFDVYDPNLEHWLMYDVMGITTTRSINIMH